MKLSLRTATTTVRLDGGAEVRGEFSFGPLQFRSRTFERFGRDGAETIGDGKMSSRTATLSLTLRGRDDAEYYTTANALFSLFSNSKRVPLYVHDADNNRRCRIEIPSVNFALLARGNERRGEVWRVSCVVPDGAWEDADAEIVADEYGLASGDSLLFDNTSPLDAWPVFVLRTAAPNPEFSFENLTTGGVFRIGTFLFVPGSTLRVSSIDGSAVIDDGFVLTDVSSAIAKNTSFLHLAPGENTLVYNSVYGAIEISAEFRRRYPAFNT